MNTIPKKLRADMQADPFYARCARYEALHDHVCERDPLRPTQPVDWEHALTDAGGKLQERFAIVPLCWLVHRGPKMVKEINVWIALNRATSAELFALTRKGGRNYFQYLKYLNEKYGEYAVVENSGEKYVNSLGINYGYPVQNAEAFF